MSQSGPLAFHVLHAAITNEVIDGYMGEVALERMLAAIVVGDIEIAEVA